jgi:hypothetical protein
VGTIASSRGAPTPSATGTPAAAHDPLALIGSWQLTGADSEPGGVLRLSDRDLTLFRPCGQLLGSWRADTNGLFVGYVHGFRGCPLPPDGQEATPAWLRVAVGFRVDGRARELLDANRTIVARLLPGGALSADPGSTRTAPPVVTDQARRDFAPAAPLPSGLVPASRDRLIGRWVADTPGGQRQQPYVELYSDGHYQGFDGCNSAQGRWAAGPGGALLAASGLSTLIGCSNVDVPRWFSGARRAAIDGGVLVRLDVTGAELGRLQRAPAIARTSGR